MAFLAIPLLEGAGEAIAAAWAAFTSSGAATAVVGGAATAAVLSLPGDKAQDKDKAGTQTQAATRTRSRNCKCPPDKGEPVERKHGVNWNAYKYQNRITGRPFDEVACRWSEEWNWLGRDFDGFQEGECLLQETKGNYDQFLDEDDEPVPYFSGFPGMAGQIADQAMRVHSNPPAKLMWYFQTPRTREYMMPVLIANAVPSVCEP
ncbi:restriction endonuclease fold toxin 5 domain-containing protein [Paraburkholderia lycopersici]|uniref:Restriction endonuclease fold toxin 5 n=1 Tax=Paraburkholderia lycopersici TaxID=416944 RepID=A0A1G7D658_9BURK|nr:restriction endonuclease fold toxin 5 domain-containing protein [Paraburkholderia lycopersici]SDE46999.1 Restriction endonuclease fold toxin 5 [Paraburkholderia lycopersici]